MLGSMAKPMIPPMIVNTPITTSSWGLVHPERSVVVSKINVSTTSPVPIATRD